MSDDDKTVSQEKYDELEERLNEWKKHARTWENRATKNADEIEKLKESKSASASEEDLKKAHKEGYNEGKKEANAEATEKMVDLAFKASAGGKFTDAQLEQLLKPINSTAFIAEDGSVDTNAISTYLSAFTPSPEQGKEEEGKQEQTTENKAHGAGGLGNNKPANNKGSLDEGADLFKNRPRKSTIF